MADNKETNSSKKGGLKRLLQSRKMRHGSLAAGITALAVTVVILINVIAGLLVDRFPDLKADLTGNNAFGLSSDTEEYIGHLKKDVKLYIVSDENTFTSAGTYFVQAKTLLDKMESKSGGKFTYEFVNTTENPNFTKNYPNINWTTKTNVGVITCGNQYKGLSLDDCFTYDQDYYNYYQSYQWTGTKIEEAVVKGALYVTSDERIVVDVLTGEGESGYEGLTALLTDNAYQVNEVSLLTGKLDENADFALIYAPQTDLSEAAAETLRTWLENGGKYGKNLIYIPTVNPGVGEMKTPNLDALLNDWGMELNKGYIYETSDDYRWNPNSIFTYLVDYTDYYKENLKNPNVPVVTNYACGITIKDSNTAHAILQTSDGAGIYPYDADESFDVKANVKGEPLAIAAEAQKAGTDTYSRVLVFSSSTMFSEEIMNYYSFNNGAYFMNAVNTIADKDDETVVIESKSLQADTLGAPTASTTNVILIIFVILLPAAMLVAGIILWIRRRNR